MKNLNFTFNVKKAFGNLCRSQTVVIVVRNSKGEYLLGAKPDFYPKGITRLLGGGIEDGESILQASQRELKEEIGVDLSLKAFNHFATLNIEAKDERGKIFNTKIHMVYTKEAVDRYSPGDDVKIISILNRKRMRRLIDSYRNLSKALWHKGEEGEFCWHDYGKIYSLVHEIALQSNN